MTNQEKKGSAMKKNLKILLHLLYLESKTKWIERKQVKKHLKYFSVASFWRYIKDLKKMQLINVKEFRKNHLFHKSIKLTELGLNRCRKIDSECSFYSEKLKKDLQALSKRDIISLLVESKKYNYLDNEKNLILS